LSKRLREKAQSPPVVT